MLDPVSGRWLVQDPEAETHPSVSPYAYVSNNPLRYVDPDGREGCEANLPGTEAGESAAQYWADLVVEGDKQGGVGGFLKGVGGWTGGLFASLWTPDTAVETAVTLGTAGVGAGVGAVSRGAAGIVTAGRGASASGLAARGTAAVVGEAAGSGATSSGAQLYRVVEGVRRSVAARELGHAEILARVAGSITPTSIPLGRLVVEPIKAQIARDPRYLKVFSEVGRGVAPAIEVSPVVAERARHLLSIFGVNLTRWRGP
jgi:hypothetical protein